MESVTILRELLDPLELRGRGSSADMPRDDPGRGAPVGCSAAERPLLGVAGREPSPEDEEALERAVEARELIARGRDPLSSSSTTSVSPPLMP